MPFSAAENITLRRLLGYADRRRESAWSFDSVLLSIGEDTVEEIRSLLERVATVETQIASQASRAGLKRAEDVEWFPHAARAELHEEGHRLLSQIAALLAIPIRQSAFRPAPLSGPCGRG